MSELWLHTIDSHLQLHDFITIFMLIGFLWGATKFMVLLKEIHVCVKEIHQAMFRMLRILDVELAEGQCGEGEHTQ